MSIHNFDHMVKYMTHACRYQKWKDMLSHARGRSYIMRRCVRRWHKIFFLKRFDVVVVCEDVLSFDVYKNAERTKGQNNWFIVMRTISVVNLNTINASAADLWQIKTAHNAPLAMHYLSDIRPEPARGLISFWYQTWGLISFWYQTWGLISFWYQTCDGSGFEFVRTNYVQVTTTSNSATIVQYNWWSFTFVPIHTGCWSIWLNKADRIVHGACLWVKKPAVYLFIFLLICHDFFFETSSDVLIPIYFSFAKQSTSFIISLFLKTCQMERKETKYRTKQGVINNNNNNNNNKQQQQQQKKTNRRIKRCRALKT